MEVGPITPAQFEGVLQAFRDTLTVFVPPERLDEAREFCRQRMTAVRVAAVADEAHR